MQNRGILSRLTALGAVLAMPFVSHGTAHAATTEVLGCEATNPAGWVYCISQNQVDLGPLGISNDVWSTFGSAWETANSGPLLAVGTGVIAGTGATGEIVTLGTAQDVLSAAQCSYHAIHSYGYNKPAFSWNIRTWAEFDVTPLNCREGTSVKFDVRVADYGVPVFGSTVEADDSNSGRSAFNVGAVAVAKIYTFPSNFHGPTSLHEWEVKVTVSSGNHLTKTCYRTQAINPTSPGPFTPVQCQGV